jgi:hypothetical protein
MSHVDDPKLDSHVDNPRAKKMHPYEKRLLFQAQCREVPCSGFTKRKPPCVVCVHEGLVRRMLSE